MYVFIALMTATSFDRTAAWLGPRRWRLLASGAYVPVVLLLVAVAGLCAAAAVGRRRARVRDGGGASSVDVAIRPQ